MMTSPFSLHGRNLSISAAVLAAAWFSLALPAAAFEGRITAVSSQSGQATSLLYTVGTNALRLEVTGSQRPEPVDVLDLGTGALTLLFPHNRSFVHLPPAAESAAAARPGFRPMPAGLPSGVGPQLGSAALPGGPAGLPPRPAPSEGLPPGVGPQGAAGAPTMPAMPGLPGMANLPEMPAMPMPGEAMELKATGETTNLLGYACERFEIKQRSEVMKVWATAGLLPFQNYVRTQPPRFGPRLLEEGWAGLLAARKLFPLRATLRLENGPEQFRFEVLSITSQKLKPEEAQRFVPPEGYYEIRPLPF